MSNPTEGVVCGTCGSAVYDRGSALDEREPCPQCGSLTRHFTRNITEVLRPTTDATGAAEEEIRRLRAEIARLSDQTERDELTKVWNRRGCNRVLAEQLGGSPDEPTAVFMLDVDHFKQVNDEHGGHVAGDAVLVEFGARLRAEIKRDGEVGRWAGDEFFVILRGADEGRACEVARRSVR
jgi:PleD family two-component response regulator